MGVQKDPGHRHVLYGLHRRNTLSFVFASKSSCIIATCASVRCACVIVKRGRQAISPRSSAITERKTMVSETATQVHGLDYYDCLGLTR